MVNVAPYRLAVAVAACSAVLMVAGAGVTSSPGVEIYRLVHHSMAGIVALLTVILGMRLPNRRLGLGLIAPLVLLAVPVGGSGSSRVLHACLAQGFFALTCAAAVVTSAGWQKGPAVVQDGGFPSLRSLSKATAVMTALQVLLGAAFRHQAMGVVPHVAGAIATTVLVLILGTFVITQFPKHAPLVRSAWVLIAVVTLQIGLGVMAFVGRLNHPDGAVPSEGLVASTVAHVVVGALTLAAAVALTLQIHFHVRSRAAVGSGLPVAS